MSNYHPDADPDFVAMDSHYMALSDEKFKQALHESFDQNIGVTCESEQRDFYHSLWKRGYKIVPVASKTLSELEAERMEWSVQTFTEATAISSLRKLESEIKEIEADILNDADATTEYADALMCLFDSTGRYGISVDQITAAFAKKLEINKARNWHKNPDNSYSHDKVSTLLDVDKKPGNYYTHQSPRGTETVFYPTPGDTPPTTDDTDVAYNILP